MRQSAMKHLTLILTAKTFASLLVFAMLPHIWAKQDGKELRT